MVQLRNRREELQSAGIEVIGISYDPVDVLKKFSDQEEIPFWLLSDEGSKTIHAYDLHFQRGLPQPATVLIDQQGTIRATLSREGYAARHSVEELLAAAKSLD